MRAALVFLALAGCGESVVCPSSGPAAPILLGPGRTGPILASPGWTLTASVSGPFVWQEDESRLSWQGEGYAEGTLRLRLRDPSGVCPDQRRIHQVRASSFESAELRWMDVQLPRELPAGSAVRVELGVRNEGWTGAWLAPGRWTGSGMSVDAGDPVWVPALGQAVFALTLVADGGTFSGQLEWGETLPALDWRGEGVEPRLLASEGLDFGVLLLGEFRRLSVDLKAETLPVDIVHVEGPVDSPFDWSEPTRVDGRAELTVRFAPTEVGDWSERLRIWWRARDRIEVHEVVLRGGARPCEALCQLPAAVSSCVGGCEIDRCLSGWWDANGRAADGCECRDVEDPAGDCAQARPLSELRDDGARTAGSGILAGPEDQDVWRVIAADGSNVFGDSFDLRVALISDHPLELCVRRAPGRWPQGSCSGGDWTCGSRHRFEGRHFRDDTQTLWLRIRSRDPTCARYRVELSNG